MLWFIGSQRVGRDWATEHLLKAQQKAITGLRTFCKLSLQESYKADTIFIILNFEHEDSSSGSIPLAITLNYHPKIGLMANPFFKKSRCLSRTVCPLWRLHPYSLPPGCTESNTVSLHLLAAIILHTFICNFQLTEGCCMLCYSDLLFYQKNRKALIYVILTGKSLLPTVCCSGSWTLESGQDKTLATALMSDQCRVKPRSSDQNK